MSRGEREWRVEDDALVSKGASGRERRYAWKDFVGIRLRPLPAPGRPWRHVLELRSKNHGKIELDNAHYLAPRTYEERSGAYTRFVRAALARIAEARPGARVLLGETPKRYFALMCLALIAFCALALALALVETPFDAHPAAAAVKFGLIVLMLPVLGRWVLGKLPRGVPLDQIPAWALPPESPDPAAPPQP